jgi:hypothetical protein
MSLSPADMKQDAIDLLRRIYGYCIQAHDGIRDGKWTLEDWNDVDHQPPVATIDDLIMVYFVSVSSAGGICQGLGLLSRQETTAIDDEYVALRPDIFWPLYRRGPRFMVTSTTPEDP